MAFRRPLPPPPESGWDGLHCDILALILKKLKQIEDFVVFGSVCKSWRILARDNKRYLAPQIPWLMLPDNPEDKYHRQIYSLSKERILTNNLYIPELYDKRCFGLNYGWVLTVTRLGGEMNLVHPISRKQFELPPHTSIEGYDGKEICPSYLFFSRLALSGNPSESLDFTVMGVHTNGDHVYYWRHGCKYWSLVTYRIGTIWGLSCYQDEFYAVTVVGTVFVLKKDHQGSIVAHLIGKVNSKALGCDIPYIVGSTRGLLVVTRERQTEEKGGEGFRGVTPRTSQSQQVDTEDEEVDVQDEEKGDEVDVGDEEEEGVEVDVPEDRIGLGSLEILGEVPEEVPEEEIEWEGWRYASVKFCVFELDLINYGYKKTTDLGDRAIFVGENSSICFERASELLGIKSNHIYFTDDYSDMYPTLSKGGGRDMGVYCLKNGQISEFKIDESSHRSRICPPFWFIPAL